MKEVRYFYVPDCTTEGALPEEEAVHAARVLRLQAGDSIFLMDGKGTFHEATLTLVTPRSCMYRIERHIPQPRTWNGHIHLAIAPTKMMERMEWLAEKATEVGFDQLTFLDCKFSERRKLRIDRIEKIVVSAAKQSRKAWMPDTTPMTSFTQFIDGLPTYEHCYIAHCYNEFPRTDFAGILQTLPTDVPVTIMIGPEGDFSTDEVQYAIDKGVTPITLGESRLRTETAGLYAVMMAQLYKRRHE